MTMPSRTYAIARIDLPDAGTHGWQVRLQRRGVKYAKYFADRVFGGERGAYAKPRGDKHAKQRREQTGLPSEMDWIISRRTAVAHPACCRARDAQRVADPDEMSGGMATSRSTGCMPISNWWSHSGPWRTACSCRTR